MFRIRRDWFFLSDSLIGRRNERRSRRSSNATGSRQPYHDVPWLRSFVFGGTRCSLDFSASSRRHRNRCTSKFELRTTSIPSWNWQFFRFIFWANFFASKKWHQRNDAKKAHRVYVSSDSIRVYVIGINAVCDNSMCAGGSKRFKFFKMFKNAFKRRRISLLTVSFLISRFCESLYFLYFLPAGSPDSFRLLALMRSFTPAFASNLSFNHTTSTITLWQCTMHFNPKLRACIPTMNLDHTIRAFTSTIHSNHAAWR